MMKKILLTVAILFSTSMADSVLLVKKGWQLIGSSTPLEDMSKFKSDSVEQVWHFDAKNQRWLGFSPDSDIQAKMSAKSIPKLDSLKNWHGFWIKSKKEWGLLLDDKSLSKAPSNENSANDIIQLSKGWNLISLPIDSVISADIFKDMTVWKYNSNREWELFDNEQSQEDFPRLAHIKNSDGIWVKAPKDTNISVMQEASKLHNFTTKEEMEEYIKEMAKANYHPYCGIEPFYLEMPVDVNTGAVSATVDDGAVANSEADLSESSSTRDASGTNLQESGVDEADIVKHNGTNIFYLVNNSINITSFEKLASGSTQAISSIPFNEGISIDSLYLHNSRLTVLSRINGNYKRDIREEKDDNELLSIPLPDYDIQQTGVDIFDVTDISDIKKVSSYKIDGDIVTSRVIGDNLYIVSNFSPRVNIKHPKEYIELSSTCKEYFNRYQYQNEPYPKDTVITPSKEKNQQKSDYEKYAECYNIQKDYESNRYYRYDYDNPIVEVQDLMPEIEDSYKKRVALIEPSKLYAPSKQNQSTSITTIANFSLSDGEYKMSNSFIGYSSTQYASSKALYLVSNQYPIYYDFNNYKERSSIYKFDLDSNLNYKAIGSVYGHPLNQFALSEYEGILRIATTEGFSWSSSGTNNSIYTLKESSELLSIEGVLSGLGKEGEIIKSVRFMRDKGYIVTFRQTDPLYTIDMSDPTQPKKVGELKVNGYSAYLHPVGEDKILGFGRDANTDGQVEGVKIELFDISDFANPTSLDSITLNRDTHSELEYNHKALAYRYSDNLFAFPYSQYGDSYLGVYQVENNLLKQYTPINSSNGYSWSGSRGLIFDLNNKTYISFFSNDKIITEELNSTTVE
jgi:uncharacterized secreted protein with C-terminal beta-propeller domain